MNVEFTRKLAIPMVVKQMYPLNDEMTRRVAELREQIRMIFRGESDSLLLVIGPCSADNAESVMDYISRLRKVQDAVGDKIMIVPRVYTAKPRTTGLGYKGLLHQPKAVGRPDMYEGITAVRKLHMRALKEAGFICADEMLYPENYRYLDDILGYVAVGARSVENQQHRLTASGIEVPVGMKNPTSGDLNVMMNSVAVAQGAHTFIYRGWEVHSKGNPYAHVILRGYVDTHGQMLPNYHYEDLCRIMDFYSSGNYLYPAVIVDTNHANSGKNPFAQVRIVREVLQNRCDDSSVRKLIKGLMIESYIEDGAQEPGGGCYGKSITDPCLGWNKTEELIYEIAARLDTEN